MRSIDNLARMWDDTGIEIKGRPNSDPSEIFNEFSCLIADFYGSKSLGLIYGVKVGQYVKGKPNHISIDVANLKTETKTDKNGNVISHTSWTEERPVIDIKVIFAGSNPKASYSVPDSPETPTIVTYPRFHAYLNPRSSELAQTAKTHREELLNYIRPA